MKSHPSVIKILPKRIILYCLYLGAALILLLGTFFCTYSIRNHIMLPVLNISVHGAVFGLLVAYLGVKYLIMVHQFGTQFTQSNETFQWRNFRRDKGYKVSQREKRGGVL